MAYRLFTKGPPLNYIFVLVIFFYLWWVISIVLKVIPTPEETLVSFREGQKPSLEHMEKEYFYFFIMEKIIFVYFFTRLSIGQEFINSALGYDLGFIISFYMHLFFIACILVKLITIIMFNPPTELKLQLAGLCLGCASLMVGAASHVLEVETKATHGGPVEPPKGPLSKYFQKQHFGCTASTAEGVDSAKMNRAVFGTKAVVYPGTNEIDWKETNRRAVQSTDPIIKARVKGWEAKCGIILDMSPDSKNSKR
jgi:hypothetical protein